MCRDGDRFTTRLFPDLHKQWQLLVELCHKAKGKRRVEGKDAGTGAADERFLLGGLLKATPRAPVRSFI